MAHPRERSQLPTLPLMVWYAGRLRGELDAAAVTAECDKYVAARVFEGHPRERSQLPCGLVGMAG